MNNVASIDLCKTLHELSGWGLMSNGTATELYWQNQYNPTLEKFRYELVNWEIFQQAAQLNIEVEHGNSIPAYPLGYLLRKLPEEIKSRILVISKQYDKYHFGYAERDNYGRYTLDDYYYKHSVYADTPENAACKLAIELFKQGVLKS